MRRRLNTRINFIIFYPCDIIRARYYSALRIVGFSVSHSSDVMMIIVNYQKKKKTIERERIYTERNYYGSI